MYEVFINEKPVKIMGNTLVNEDNVNTLIVDTSEPGKMMNALLKFAGSGFTEVLIFISNESPEKQFSAFSSVFRVLEAAGGFVVNNKQEALFIYRFGRWDLPKGKIEKGEQPREAAMREVEEETGIRPDKIVTGLSPTYHIYEYKGNLILKKTYWYRMHYSGCDSPVPQTDEGIEKAEWVAASGFGSVMSSTYASLHRLISSESDYL